MLNLLIWGNFSELEIIFLCFLQEDYFVNELTPLKGVLNRVPQRCWAGLVRRPPNLSRKAVRRDYPSYRKVILPKKTIKKNPGPKFQAGITSTNPPPKKNLQKSAT